MIHNQKSQSNLFAQKASNTDITFSESS